MGEVILWIAATYLWLGGAWWMFKYIDEDSSFFDVVVNYLVCFVFWPVALVAKLIRKGLGVWA